MLRKRKFDQVSLGKNILSLIHGLLAIKSGSSSLLVDDGLTSLNFYEWNHLNYFESVVLKEKLKELNIKSETFVKEAKISVLFQQKVGILGQRLPSENLRELCRRYSQIFSTSSFDEQEFNETILNLGDLLAKDPGAFRKAIKERSATFDFLSATAAILGKPENNQSYLALSFHEFYRQFSFHKKCSVENILELVLPRFELNYYALQEYLLKMYHSAGGFYTEAKITGIKDYSHDRSFKVIDLSSFDGKILGKNFTSFGGKNESGTRLPKDGKDVKWDSICLRLKLSTKLKYLQKFSFFYDSGHVMQNHFGPVFGQKQNDHYIFYSYFQSGFGSNHYPMKKEFYRYISVLLEHFLCEELSPFEHLEFLDSKDLLAFENSFSMKEKKLSFQNLETNSLYPSIRYRGSGLYSNNGRSQQFSP